MSEAGFPPVGFELPGERQSPGAGGHIREIEIVLREHGPRLMALPGVVSVAQGVCDGAPCIRILVARKSPEVLTGIPSSIGGYRVRVDGSGPIRPL